jgi:hypothetical protein
MSRKMEKSVKHRKSSSKNKTVKNTQHLKSILKKHNISSGSGKKMSRAEAISKLNLGVFGLNWRDKARSFNYDEEHVIANVMQGHQPFKHHVHFKERKAGHKFKL